MISLKHDGREGGWKEEDEEEEEEEEEEEKKKTKKTKKRKKKKKKQKRKNEVGIVRQSVFNTRKQNVFRFPACAPSSIL